VGRKHAAKANQLAAKNKCKGAVVEFSKAYRLLKDATLLFNRAECYRKMGKTDEALKDYERFLGDMPAAPNRQNVEERIATLRAGAKPEAVPSAPAAAPSAPAEPAASPSSASPSGSPAAASPGAPPQDKEPSHRAEKWAD
jgi:tetratricopeptide (TPR) repeat protein